MHVMTHLLSIVLSTTFLPILFTLDCYLRFLFRLSTGAYKMC